MKTKIIGVPLHLGADRCGLEFGVDNFLNKYPDYKEEVEVLEIEKQEEDFSIKNGKYLNTIADTCEKLAIKVNKSIEDKEIPIILGGDHSVSIGSIAGVSKSNYKGDLYVLWVDAHGDLNTLETTETGNIHGMPLAASIGYGDPKLVDCFYKGKKIKSENIILFGTRAIDKKEQELIDELEIKNYSWEKIKEMGFENALGEIKEILRDKNLHLSFDLDSIDPQEITAVGTPVVGGFSKKMGLEIVGEIIEVSSLKSMDLVEYNPRYEKENETVEYMDTLLKLVKKSIFIK